MTRLYHLETTHEDRSTRVASKKRALEQRKRLAMIDALQRLRQRTEAVLVDLKKAASLLDQSIEIELQNSPTRNPRDVSFPMSARALIARRDNLRATIVAITKEMAQGGPSRVFPRGE